MCLSQGSVLFCWPLVGVVARCRKHLYQRSKLGQKRAASQSCIDLGTKTIQPGGSVLIHVSLNLEELMAYHQQLPMHAF